MEGDIESYRRDGDGSVVDMLAQVSERLSLESKGEAPQLPPAPHALDVSEADLDEFPSATDRDEDMAHALELLQHASMLVQLENEGFMEEHFVEELEEKEAKKYLPGGNCYAGIWPVFEKQFWLDSIILIFLGAFLGLACIGYQYAITSAPRAYLTVDNPGFPNENVGYFEGQLWWIGIGAGCGLVVGAVRELLNLQYVCLCPRHVFPCPLSDCIPLFYGSIMFAGRFWALWL